MAKIIVTIEADSPEDYAHALVGMAKPHFVDHPAEHFKVDYDDRGVAVVVPKDEEMSGVRVDDPQPQRRTRRTKEQMAADVAAQATAPSGDPNQQSDPGVTDAGQNSGQTATTDASLSDLAGAVDAADGDVTKEQVMAAFKKAMEASSPAKVQEKLKTHPELNGATRLSEIPVDKFAVAKAFLEEIAAG